MVTKSVTVDSISDTHKGKSCEDEKTECSTPFCSPEREIAAGKTDQCSQSQIKVEETSPQMQQQDQSQSRSSPAKSAATETSESSVPVSVSSGTSHANEDSSKENNYKDWPMVDIKEPSGNDVLYGRGGGTNHHEGNKRYRKMVELRKVDYVNSKRLDKPLVALDIIRQWRDQKPPGRFLKLDESSGLWSDVGDKKAREKTSQALREKAPLLRKQQEELLRESAPIPLSTNNEPPYPNNEQVKTTRFNIPPKDVKPSKNIRRGLLARDHSLGVDYVPADEPVSIKGFSWDAADNAVEEESSDEPPPLPQPSSWNDYGRSQPQQRPLQQYSFGSFRPNTQDSTGPASASMMNSHERQHSLSVNPLHGASAGIQATSSFTEGYPHTPSGVSGPSSHWSQHPGYPQPSPPRSDERLQAEWTKPRYGDSDGDYRQTRSAECDYRSRPQQWHHNSGPSHHNSGPSRGHGHERVHSDDYANRYAHAPSPDNGYMQHSYDGYNNNNGYQHYSNNSTMQPPGPYSNHRGGMEWSSPSRSPDSMPYSGQSQMQHSMPPPNPPMSNYNASSGMNPGYGGSYMDRLASRNHMMDGNSPSSVSNSIMNRTVDASGSNVGSPSRALPRPQNIKRDTSHQCENDETKSHVKRMNRQRSIGHTNSMSSLNEVSEMDMVNLRSHLRQSSIGQADDVKGGNNMHPLKRPTSLRSHDRVPTIDCFQLGIDSASSPLDDTNGKLERPQPLGGGHRGSSVASIQIEDIAGIINKPSSLMDNDRGSTLGSVDPDLLHHVEI